MWNSYRVFFNEIFKSFDEFLVNRKDHLYDKDSFDSNREDDHLDMARELREKYDRDKKIKVLSMYLEGVVIRSNERLENVPNPLIIKWIRKNSKILRQKLNETKIPDDVKDIQIIALDELFSYCQKKLTKSTYGLLLIESEVKLLTLK